MSYHPQSLQPPAICWIVGQWRAAWRPNTVQIELYCRKTKTHNSQRGIGVGPNKTLGSQLVDVSVPHSCRLFYQILVTGIPRHLHASFRHLTWSPVQVTCPQFSLARADFFSGFISEQRFKIHAKSQIAPSPKHNILRKPRCGAGMPVN